MGWVFKNIPKDGTPGYKLGWIHGCESGLGTQFGGAIYQSFYTWKRDRISLYQIRTTTKFAKDIKKN